MRLKHYKSFEVALGDDLPFVISAWIRFRLRWILQDVQVERVGEELFVAFWVYVSSLNYDFIHTDVFICDFLSIYNERIKSSVVIRKYERSSYVHFYVRFASKKIDIVAESIDLRLTHLHILILEFLKPVRHNFEHVGTWIGRL